MTSIRTRFAPSPTGFMHVGNLRTGLFAYLVARSRGGAFILRLEDTDKSREVKGSAEHILACLTALSIDYDEGIEKGGPYAPYRQSERLDTYQTWAKRLIEQGRAYADPYTSAEVQAFREAAQKSKKAFLYRDHRPEHPPVWDGTQPLRFKSDPKAYRWHDAVMGDLASGPEVIDDFILIKSDGYPTYNFAHIVDDAEMCITHVIRGQEFISSQPNYLNLYEALGFDMAAVSDGVTHLSSADLTQPTSSDVAREDDETMGSDGTSDATSFSDGSGFPPAARQDPDNQMAASGSEGKDGGGANRKYRLPIFATMPHILSESGGKKLGKRDGAKDVLDYLRDGFLPETMVSFIATLGWNDGTTKETFTMDELIRTFNLDRVQRSGARFDDKRLLWMNGQFIRELPLDELYQRVTNFWPSSAAHGDEDYKKQVLALVQDRLKTLADLAAMTTYFFEEPTQNWELISGNKQLKKLSREEVSGLLQAAHTALTNTDDWSIEAIQATLNQLLESTGQKPGILFSLIRIATTWAPFSPELPATLALLGKETTLTRLDQTIAG